MRYAIFLIAVALWAQNPAQIQPTTTNPNGTACTARQLKLYTPSGVIYSCSNGTFASSGGSGTVTGSGTANELAYWSGSTALGTTGITKSGSDYTFPANVSIGNTSINADGTATFGGTLFSTYNGRFLDSQPSTSNSPIIVYGRNSNNLGGLAFEAATAGGSQMFFGAECSAGGCLLSGSIGHAGIITNEAAALPIQFGTNDAVRGTIQANGEWDIGTATAAGGSQLFAVAGGTGTNGDIIRGTRFTCSGGGCTPTAGAATAGTFTTTTTGAATFIVTMGGSGFTAPAGFNCSANNLTTANLIRMTTSSTTTATFTGVTVSGDTISFDCHGY